MTESVFRKVAISSYTGFKVDTVVLNRSFPKPDSVLKTTCSGALGDHLESLFDLNSIVNEQWDRDSQTVQVDRDCSCGIFNRDWGKSGFLWDLDASQVSLGTQDSQWALTEVGTETHHVCAPQAEAVLVMEGKVLLTRRDGRIYMVRKLLSHGAIFPLFVHQDVYPPCADKNSCNCDSVLIMTLVGNILVWIPAKYQTGRGKLFTLIIIFSPSNRPCLNSTILSSMFQSRKLRFITVK